MESLLKAMLAEDCCLGDNKEIKKVTPIVIDGEQTYTVTVFNYENDGETEHCYTNSDLLGFIYEKSIQKSND
jgi:hypothetical protein